jgi:Acetyltransferase (GNAT) domain
MWASGDPVWVVRSEVLAFQFGPFNLGSVGFTALSLLSNPFLVSPDLEPPVEQAVANGCQAVVKYATPISENFPTMRIERRVIRYATRFGVRYVVDISGPFSEYLQKFSGATRGRLRRTVKKAVGVNSIASALREYRSPPEMMQFRDIAIAISNVSFKQGLGWGFQEDEKFRRQLEADAAAGTVRGYVLFLDGEPAAYRFCRIEQDVMVDKQTGYDERFAKLSPGTVLLFLILERLFAVGEFRIFDFDGTEYFAFKEFFATRRLPCARVVWFRPTIRNIAIVAAHWPITAAWRLAAAYRVPARRHKLGWPSVRRLSRQWARALTKPQPIH